MTLPWELDDARSQLRRRLGAYLLAMARAERWDGGSLTRRREELRELADRCSMRVHLEVVLKRLEQDHARRPGHRDTVTSGGRIVRDARS